MNESRIEPNGMRNVQRLLWAVVLLLVVSAAIDGYFLVDDLKYREDVALRYTFSERAQRLATDIQWERLLQVSLDRQKSLPDDPWSYYWAGVAHYRKKDKDFDSAKASFEKAVETDPLLRDQVNPWLQAIAETKKKPSRKR